MNKRNSAASEPLEHKNVKKFREEKKVIGCKKHATAYLITDQHTGDLLCSKCGYVADERMISDEAEWRNFGDDTNAEKWEKSRIGGAENPFFSDDANLGTIIRSFGTNNNRYSTFGANVLNLSKRHSVDNALQNAFVRITEMCDRINLPGSVVQCAKKVYHDVYRQLQLKGNILFIDSKVAASVYIACRLEDCPRTSREIAAISEVMRHDILNSSKRIIKVLKLDVNKVDCGKLITRICKNVGLSIGIERIANEIVEKTHKKVKARYYVNPEKVAGAIIYLAQQQTGVAYDEDSLKVWRTNIGESINIDEDEIQKIAEFIQN